MTPKRKAYQEQRRKQKPWLRLVEYAKRRCTDPNHKSYPWYGARGIKCTLTKEEIEQIWIRDEAFLMNTPSLERKDVNKDYCFENCMILELKDNVANRHRKQEWEE